MPHLKLDIGDFVNSGFDDTKVTGVRIHLQRGSAPLANQTVTIMAIRALLDGWVESWLDMDTRWGFAAIPVTLDGNPYGGSVAQAFEFVRGDRTRNDPIPADGAYTLFFFGGGATSPVDAISPVENIISIIFRDVHDDIADTGSAIFARLIWNDSLLKFEAQRMDTTGGSPGAVAAATLFDETINTSGLDPSVLYAFNVKLVGTTLTANLYEVNHFREITATVWNSSPINSDTFIYQNGRVGFHAELRNRDSYIDAIVQAPTSFAILRTQVYETRSPVDGLKLAAVFSSDANLFLNIAGDDAWRDQTKTVSGLGGIRTAKGITTNQFIVDDWPETYLNVAIWVSTAVTRANQPVIQLNTGSILHFLEMPDLKPSQWNYLHFDLGIFRNLITGLPYSFSFNPGPNPDKPLGNFWVDNFMIGRRRVAWSGRATENGVFRRMWETVNDPRGALHFNPEERGTHLQLEVEALTEDAWISSFQLMPHYAELGAPLYDRNFETQ